MADQTKEDVLREFFDFRFQSLDDKIDKLGRSLERLAGAVITREFFDELNSDVKSLHEDNERLEARVVELETKSRLLSLVLTGSWAITLPLLVSKLQEWLG